MPEEPSQVGAIDAIVLAAGASSRMGTPKQLLLWRGKSAINHLVEEVLAVDGIRNLLLVHGEHSDRICAQLPPLPRLTHCINPDPSRGLASSIHCGVNHASWQPTPPDSVLILLTDQLWVNQQRIRNMLELADRGSENLVATAFPESEGSFGPPAIFGTYYWPHLLALEGDRGAKSVLNHFRKQLRLTAMRPAGIDDCDTPADYRNWAATNDHFK